MTQVVSHCVRGYRMVTDTRAGNEMGPASCAKAWRESVWLTNGREIITREQGWKSRVDQIRLVRGHITTCHYCRCSKIDF